MITVAAVRVTALSASSDTAQAVTLATRDPNGVCDPALESMNPILQKVLLMQ